MRTERNSLVKVYWKTIFWWTTFVIVLCQLTFTFCWSN